MRRRLLASMVGLVVAVLLVVGAPLVVVVSQLARSEAASVLRRQAEAIAADVADQALRSPAISTRQLAGYVPPGDRLTFVTADGRAVTAGALRLDGVIAVEVDAVAGSRLRLETSAAPVERRRNQALLTLGAVGALALAAAVGVAAWLGERLTRPLADLAGSADRLGRGDFSTTAPRSGIDEADTIAAALDASAARIAGLVRSEREFSANASHQLRTALTGLRLRLEALAGHPDPSVVADAGPALEQAERLSDTVDDLLRLARTGRYADPEPFDLTTVVVERAAALARAHPERRVTTHTPDHPVVVHAAQGAVGQAVEVLVHNALVHGRGEVSTTVVTGDGFASVVVEDDGELAADHDPFAGSASGSGHGIGLRLARTLVQADGGRLDLVSRHPTAFRVMLPAGGAPRPR